MDWRYGFTLVVTVIFLGLSLPPPTDAESVVISVIDNEETHELAIPIVREAYSRIGYTATFDRLPARRALEWANDGVTDGDLARIAGTEKQFPNLIRISIPVFRITAVAFAVGETRPISEWHDLRGLTVGIIRGIRYSEIGTRGMEPIPANDMTHLFKLLTLGRIDVAVAVLDAGRIEIHRHYPAAGIHPVGEPLFIAPLYHYVHVKNGHLVQKLEAVLEKMEAKGEIRALRKTALGEKLSP
jgi:ABC-type amino acid transport substrate-binding protein